MNLCTNITSMISLITELYSNLCTSLPSLRRLNPELVRPCNRSSIITNLVNLIHMNSKYVVAFISCFCLNIRRIWTSSRAISSNSLSLIIIVASHCQRPCTDFTSTITSPVSVDTISLLKSPCRPCSELSITNIFTITLRCSSVTIISNHLEPSLYYALLLLVSNLKTLPHDFSICVRLCNKIT